MICDKLQIEGYRSRLLTILSGCALVLSITQLGWASQPAQETAPVEESHQSDSESVELGVIVAPSPGTGVLVSTTIWGSPAEEAGIRTGDYILSVDDEQVSSPEELREMIHGKKPGSKVKVAVWRQTKEITKEIVLASGVTESPVERRAWLGVVLESSDGSGAKIARVHPSSSARRDGLRQGDVVVAIKGQDVESAEQMIDLIRDLKPETEVELVVRRDGKERKVTVTLGSARAAPWRWLHEAFRPPLEKFDWHWTPGVPQEEYRRFELRIEALQREVKRLRKEVQRLRKGEVEQLEVEPNESTSDTHNNLGTPALDQSQYYGRYGPYYKYPVLDRSVYRYRVPAQIRPPVRYDFYYYYHSRRPYYFRDPYIYGSRFGVEDGS